MKSLFLSCLLAVLLCTLYAEAASPPVCYHQGSFQAMRAGQSIILFKPRSGCIRQITCQNDYTLAVTECKRTLCPADKALEKDVFPDCCCL